MFSNLICLIAVFFAEQLKNNNLQKLFSEKFKYYQELSVYSTEVYNFYFNEYEPFSAIIELPSQNTGIASLKQLTDTSKADYIVFFNNVHTETKYGMQILKLTTSLYSKK